MYLFLTKNVSVDDFEPGISRNPSRRRGRRRRTAERSKYLVTQKNPPPIFGFEHIFVTPTPQMRLIRPSSPRINSEVHRRRAPKARGLCNKSSSDTVWNLHDTWIRDRLTCPCRIIVGVPASKALTRDANDGSMYRIRTCWGGICVN